MPHIKLTTYSIVYIFLCVVECIITISALILICVGQAITSTTIRIPLTITSFVLFGISAIMLGVLAISAIIMRKTLFADSEINHDEQNDEENDE